MYRGPTYDDCDDERKGVNQVAFRAKKYENRKEEKKLQVSGDQREFAALIKGDKDTAEAFNSVVTEALKK